MADVTISGLPDLAPTSNTYLPLSNGTTTGKALTNSLPGLTPIGGIIMWSGSIVNIPANWALCNGLNGTPDLRDRFVIGSGSSYAVGTTGGSKDAVVVSHSHTIDDPGHTHNYIMGGGNGTTGVYSYFGSTPYNQATSSGNIVSKTTGISINTTGQSGTNANLPPYYALAYIMRVS